MWWIFYMLPSGPVLHGHRDRSFVWGYGLIVPIAAIVATGAGLHVAAYFIEGKAHIGALATVLTVAIPVSVFLLSIYSLYYYLVRQFDLSHVGVLLATAAVVAAAVMAAVSGVSMAACLIILMFAPAVTVLGYEIKGHRDQAKSLAEDPDIV
jgi:hypothetical protein